jgi:putative inorganic carbon (hco3(-)) transporter
VLTKARREQTPEEKEKAGQFLYWWLLLVVFFEYARPGYQYHFLAAIPLNSLLPLALLFVSLVAGNQRSWSEIARDKMWIWPGVMVFFVLVSMSWATVTTYAFNTFTLILGYLILFFLIARIITTRKRLRGLFLTLIVSHIFLIIYNPLVVTDPYIRHYIAGATFLGDGNDFSLSLVILLPFSLELVMGAQKKVYKITFLLLLAILILAIIGTQSRGASLGMGTAFAYLWWRSPRKVPGLVALGIVLFGVLLYAPDVYFSRMKTLSNPEQESSAEARFRAWKAGARMAQDHVLGVGAGNFPNNFPKYRDNDAPVRWMTAHSMYFLALGELGFLGLLLVLGLVFGNVLGNVKLRNRVVLQETGPPDQVKADVRLLNMMAASALGFSVSGAFLSVTYYPHVYVLTALFIATRCLVESGYPGLAEAKRPNPVPRRSVRTTG